MGATRAGSSRELRLLSGWGRASATASWVERPQSEPDVMRALADPGPRGALARGLGRSYGDAAQNAGGTVLDMTALAGIRGFDAATGVVTVDAGVTLDALMRALLPHGWFVPVTPGTRFVTVGGALAADVHGKNHHRDGGFARHVNAFELRTPGGESLRVTPGGSPEVFWATAGGMGLTGVIVEATIRMTPVETAFVRVDTDRAADLDEVMARMAEGDEGYRYSVAWVDCLARGASLGRAVLTRGDHATLAELPARARSRALAFEPREAGGVPGWMPAGLLTSTTARAFNEVWFRRAPRSERGRLQSIAGFFHPLDGVRGWNRLYGARGFVQYQLAVPFGAEDVVRRVVGDIADRHCPSFLAVLKRFGPQEGLLSFPLPGWTLAVDIPAGAGGLGALLDRWDALVAAAGGRVYLAKDARLRPEVFARMYPRLPEWRAIRERLDPQGRMRSDLARRLGL